MLDSNTHQHYLFAGVGGSHNKTFTGFPLGGLSAEDKSLEVIQRHTAFLTTTMAPKNSHNHFWSLQPALSEVWNRYCSPPCLLMSINQTMCLKMLLLPPLSRGPENAVFLCLLLQQAPFPQCFSCQLATALQPQYASSMHAWSPVIQSDAKGCLSQIACIRLLSKMLCLFSKNT